MRANDQNLVIASNKRLSKALVGSEEWRGIHDALPCWTGTMTGYEEPGKKFGKIIEYVDPETDHRWVFHVPEKYRGEQNAILVAEHPDYTLEVEGKNRVVHAPANWVDLVREFPAESEQWYKGDSKHDIPQGDQVSSNNEDARYAWRSEKRVGPAARIYYSAAYIYRRGVILDARPSYDLGLAVEATEDGNL